MAASMVSTKIRLSMPFSCATCSMIAPKLASKPSAACTVLFAMFVSSRTQPLATARHGSTTSPCRALCVRSAQTYCLHVQDQPRRIHVGQLNVQLPLLRVEGDAPGLVEAEQHALQHELALNRLFQLELGQLPSKSLIISRQI